MRRRHFAVGRVMTGYGPCPPPQNGCPPGYSASGCVPSGGMPVGQGFDPTVYEVDETMGGAARRWTLSFVSLAVPANGQVTVQTNPQHLFRPERLVIPASIGVNFTVDQILIGNRPQSVAAGALPGETFSQVAVGVGALFDSVEPGVLVSLQVTNIDPVNPHNFRATFFGATIVGTP